MADESGAGRKEADRPNPELRVNADGDGDGDGPGELSMRALAMPELKGCGTRDRTGVACGSLLAAGKLKNASLPVGRSSESDRFNEEAVIGALVLVRFCDNCTGPEALVLPAL
jgi:hypothetical protein